LKIRSLALFAAAAFYAIAGGLHFLRPEFYLKIMPPWIPWHLAMVDVSGAAEIAGGLGLLVPRLRRPAAWGLVALLVAVFPANIYMAAAQVQVTQTPLSPAILWGRLALQPIFIWWVLWCSAAPRDDGCALK
jgi:uncharacterized membrane protein